MPIVLCIPTKAHSVAIPYLQKLLRVLCEKEEEISKEYLRSGRPPRASLIWDHFENWTLLCLQFQLFQISRDDKRLDVI